ncbi:MAG: class I SAM-dependent methyltransferase [Candidatus Heimdallarchaeota archaeon]
MSKLARYTICQLSLKLLLKGLEYQVVNKKQIAERYDSSAEIYDTRYTDIQIHKYNEILSRVALADEHSIIDVGCGTGSLLGLIASGSHISTGKSFIGIDLSYEMIKIAHEKFPDIDFIVADSDNLPFREDTFDRVFSVTHLQNLPDPQNTLSEMERIATSKAKLAISILRKTWSLEKLRDSISETNLEIEDDWIAQIEDIGILCSKP